MYLLLYSVENSASQFKILNDSRDNWQWWQPFETKWKTVEECDEIGRFVYTSKDAFTHNNNVKEILREAAQVGGMPKTGSYTIVWRQTDAGVNSDKEEFVVNY